MSSATPRSQDPPFYQTFAARNVTAPDFNAWKPHDVKSNISQYPVTQLAWNVDGQRLATCGNERTVRLWHPEETTSPQKCTLTGTAHKSNATSLAWSTKHPELFCSASDGDKTLMFWDARKKDPTHKMEVKSSIIRIAYAPDGDSVLILDKYSTFSRLQFQTMTIEKDSTTPTWSFVGDPYSKLHGATDFKFNHVSDLIFVSTNSGSIACIEYPTMDLVDTFNAHLGSCNALDLDPRGGYLATGGSDSMINIFNNVEMLIHKAISETESVVNIFYGAHTTRSLMLMPPIILEHTLQLTDTVPCLLI
ncbi:hypothetical protein FRB94_008094 [Tulasnella sp. JGI-2019a]|nr:hypothetical protein FRB94_008094 [Tulasnella sp. JGI-2019a]